MILHWLPAGLAKWLGTAFQINPRVIIQRFLKQADPSIVLSNYNLADANKLFPRRVRVVHNGIPDRCPDFVRNVLPLRRARFATRATALTGGASSMSDGLVIRVLYVAHCTREKGILDAMRAVVLANRALAGISRFHPSPRPA